MGPFPGLVWIEEGIAGVPLSFIISKAKMQLEKHGNKWDYGKGLSPWTLQAGTDLTIRDGKMCL